MPSRFASVGGPGAHPGVLRTALPFVYILRCGDGSLYTGIALDLVRRLNATDWGRPQVQRSRLPVTLVWKRRLLTWRRALQESIDKALTRTQKEALLSVAPRPDRAAAVRENDVAV